VNLNSAFTTCLGGKLNAKLATIILTTPSPPTLTHGSALTVGSIIHLCLWVLPRGIVLLPNRALYGVTALRMKHKMKENVKKKTTTTRIHLAQAALLPLYV